MTTFGASKGLPLHHGECCGLMWQTKSEYDAHRKAEHGGNMSLIYTLRPAIHMFADIAAAYRYQGLACPESVEDGWEQYKRIEEEAQHQIDLGLWD